MRSAFVLLLAALTLAAGTVRLSAWGPSGHRIVALIAARHLKEPARTAVRTLLQDEPEVKMRSLAGVANWADDIKDDSNADWHFVDIPRSAPAYSAARDCPAGECVVAKIDEFAAVLRQSAAPKGQRRDALKSSCTSSAISISRFTAPTIRRRRNLHGALVHEGLQAAQGLG